MAVSLLCISCALSVVADRSTRRSSLAPTSEAIKEADNLLRSLRQADPETIESQVVQIKDALEHELAASMKRIQERINNNQDRAYIFKPQEQKIKDKIERLQNISIGPNSINASLAQLAQFDTKNTEIIQAIRSALISSAMHSVVEPENIRNLRNTPDTGSLTAEQISSLGEFFNHHVIQEFWEKQGLITTRNTKKSGSSATGTPSIRGWEEINRTIEASQQASAQRQPVKFIANSSLFIRTVAGAMGDACYSQEGEIVPESADVITMTNEDMTKILGNFLVLDSEYLDENSNRQKIKVLRAINPLESTLSRYHLESMLDAVIGASKQLLPEGYSLAVIVDTVSNAATTNRPQVLAKLHGMMKSGKINGSELAGVSPSVNFNGYNSTGSVYLVP